MVGNEINQSDLENEHGQKSNQSILFKPDAPVTISNVCENVCGYPGLKTVDLATLRATTDWDTVARRLGDKLASHLSP